MRRIEAKSAREARQHPHIGAALGAMAVNDFGAEPSCMLIEPQQVCHIAEPRHPAHGHDMNAEFARASHVAQPGDRDGIARRFAHDDFNLEPRLVLTLCKIADMAKEPPERRAHHMHHPQAFRCIGHRAA